MLNNFNKQITNSSFGMAIHSNSNVNNVIKSRIKSAAELEKLNNIIEKQKKNKLMDIQLLINPDGKSISANVYPINNINVPGNTHKQFSENTITKMFGGIVGFIEKAANYADKTTAKLQKKNLNYEDVLTKMTD